MGGLKLFYPGDFKHESLNTSIRKKKGKDIMQLTANFMGKAEWM